MQEMEEMQKCSLEPDDDMQLQTSTNWINGNAHLMTFTSEFSPKGKKKERFTHEIVRGHLLNRKKNTITTEIYTNGFRKKKYTGFKATDIRKKYAKY